MVVTCEECGKVVQNSGALRMHRYWKHGDSQKATPEATEKPRESEALNEDVVSVDLEIEGEVEEGNNIKIDKIINRCECGYRVTEDMEECPDCGAELIWGDSE